MMSKEFRRFFFVMSKMMSAWLVGYVGVMVRRKMIFVREKFSMERA